MEARESSKHFSTGFFKTRKLLFIRTGNNIAGAKSEIFYQKEVPQPILFLDFAVWADKSIKALGKKRNK